MKEAEVAEKFAQQRADAQGSLEEEETEEPFVPAEARVKGLGNLLFRYDHAGMVPRKLIHVCFLAMAKSIWRQNILIRRTCCLRWNTNAYGCFKSFMTISFAKRNIAVISHG